MSDSNRVAKRWVRQADPGIIPGNPVFQTTKHTGIQAGFTPQTVQSQKISGSTTSRGVTDTPLVGIEVGGGWNFELEFYDQDRLFPGLFQNEWVEQPFRSNRYVASQVSDITSDTITVTGTESFAAGQLIRTSGFANPANNKVFVAQGGTGSTLIVGEGLTDESAPVTAEVRRVGVLATEGDIEATTDGGNAIESSSLNFTTLGLNVGQWIRLDGFATAPCNGYARVRAINMNRLDLDNVHPDFDADDGSGVSIRIWLSDFIRDGLTKIFYAMEDAYTDHNPVDYLYTLGQHPDTMSLTLETQSIVTGALGFMGFDGEWATARPAGATTMAPPANGTIQTSSNVARIAENGHRIDTPNYVIRASLQVSNNSRRQNAIGHVTSVGIGSGDFTVTGNATTYFGDAAIARKVIANEESGLDIAFQDQDHHALVFDIPRLKYTGGVPNVTGRNTDVEFPADFQGLEHPVFGYTMSVSRFHAVGGIEEDDES